MDTGGILSDLTDAQRVAVTHRDGPLLVIAGAGSGKTRVVTRRIAWLLSEGVYPSSILAMTFTNKAAREMRERVAALTGCEYLNVGTFHSLCARFLRRELDSFPEAGRTGGFTIYDEDDRLKVLTECQKAMVEGGCLCPAPKTMLRLISDSKNSLTPIAKLVCRSRYYDGNQLSLYKAFEEAYETRMRQCNAVDFDDLLFLMRRLLDERPDVLDRYRRRFRYVLVDEYQDTNRLQYELVRLLCGEDGNLHVTGDPDQSIYSWRGADYRNIMEFEKDFPSATVVKLEQNYRSTGTILAAANEVIGHNKWRFEKTLFTENPHGEKLHCYLAESEKAEASSVVERIAGLNRKGVPFRDIAVFYRTNSQSRALEEAIVRRNLPYQLLGGVRFYERQEVKDLLAVLRLKANDADELALQRVIAFRRCGIGPKTLGRIAERAHENFQTLFAFLCSHEFLEEFGRSAKIRDFAEWCVALRDLPAHPVGEAIKAVIDHAITRELAEKQYGLETLEERMENLDSLLGRARDYDLDNPDGNLIHFLEETALVADVDGHDAHADSVSLMTLHSSKGLEFPYVFIVGLENGLLPHIRSDESDAGLEEERRLFYVGLTRAKRAVFLSFAAVRFQYGTPTRMDPSCFLTEIPNALIDFETTGRFRTTYGGGRGVGPSYDGSRDGDEGLYDGGPRDGDEGLYDGGPQDGDEGLYYDYSEGDASYPE